MLYQSRLRSGSYSRDFSEQNIYSAIDVASKLLYLFKADSIRLGVINDLYFAIYRHLRYMVILSAFRANNFKEHETYCILIKEFSLATLSRSFMSIRNLQIYEIVLHFLSRNPRVIWIAARVLKFFNYQPY